MNAIPPECKGALAYRALDDGQCLALYPLVTGTVRICLGPTGEQVYDDAWCYQRPIDGILATVDWDGKGDPPGPWFRHIGTGRRRYYDAAGELVREEVRP